MSVVSWKRDESKVEYLYRTYELNLLIARIVASKSKKYKANYGDTLIKNGLDALKHLEIANSIYVSTKEDFILRRNHLLEARGIIDSLSTIAYIFLEITRTVDANGKADKQEEQIGELTRKCVGLITGVIKSDKARHKDIYS